MPPGIGDETLDVIRLIKKIEFLVVTTPSKVSISAVNKLLKILRELKIPVIGLLENMKMTELSIIKDTFAEKAIPFIGSIFYDKNLEVAIGDSDLVLNTKFMEELDDNLKKINL
jgi:ATP-binding protein involved in chromosome partitioning